MFEKCNYFKTEIEKRDLEIASLKNEVDLIMENLYNSFDEWNECTDLKKKDKLEWARNKVSSPASKKIHRITQLRLEIKDIEAEIIQYIRACGV